MKILLSLILMVLFACASTHTLIPCYKTDINQTYNKVNIYKEAKLLIKSPFENTISLKFEDKIYQFVKEDDTFTSINILEKGLYKINKKINKVEEVSYFYDEDILYNENLKANKINIIKPGLTHNSLSKCMCDTNDWFILSKESNCKYKKYNISLNTIYTDNINFEIIEAGLSKGKLKINQVYSFDDKLDILIHVFYNKGSFIYPYFINVEELCYPKKIKVKVIEFIEQGSSSSVLVDAGYDDGLSIGMNYFFIDKTSLKLCSILSITKDKGVCVFSNLLIEKLPNELDYYLN